MTVRRTRTLVLPVAVALATIGLPPTTARAQDPPPPPDPDPPDPDSVIALPGLLVTARNREENAIRGVGQRDYLPVTDPGVAVYVDGIYMARSIGAVMDLLDIGRVEVLRGPQGTLFGRNAVGGAVSIRSRRPDGPAGGSLRATLGSDRMTNFTATVAAPLANRLHGGLVLVHLRRDGYVTRVHDGLDMGDDDVQAARGTLAWRPSDGLEVFATADYSRSRENGAPAVSGGVNDLMAFGTFGNGLLPGCAAITINPGFPAEGPPSFPPPGTGARRAPGCFGPHSFAGEYVAEGTFPAFADLDSWGGGTELTWTLGSRATLRSLTGYRGMRLEASRDADNTPANILSTRQLLDHTQISEELQLSGLAADERVHWQTGVYFFREHGYQHTAVIVPTAAPGTYKPETVSSYELGLKSILAGGRARLNLALFRADYDDLQITIRESFNPLTFNGGAADISGAEIEAALAPGDGWDIRANLGSMRARYDSLSPSVLNNATPVLPGYSLAKTPGFSHALSIARTAAATDRIVATPRITWSFTGSQFHDAINTQQLFQDGHHLLNASLALLSRDGRWEVVTAARNLTDERHLITGNSSFATASAYMELVYGRPREWSVSLTRRW